MENPKNPLTVRVILQLLVFIVLVPFLPVALITIFLFVRTGLEDRTLRHELPG
ncbi:MAG: hypothetical protein WBL25_01425 [Anaerolineales bacterium]